MESEFLINMKEISLEIILVALAVLCLTMLVKWPIKKLTSKLDESKRKAINTIIIFIPLLLSLVINILYFGIFKSDWFGTKVFEAVGSAYILSVTFYAIYSRVIILIKGLKKQEGKVPNLGKEAMEYIKNNLKIISKTLKVDEKKLNNVMLKISDLLAIKEEINQNATLQDISSTEKIDSELEQLKSEEKKLKALIFDSKKQITIFQNTITKKENKNEQN